MSNMEIYPQGLRPTPPHPMPGPLQTGQAGEVEGMGWGGALGTLDGYISIVDVG